ncbi:hypothetical protein [Microbacterium sp. LWH11-1.2]|uniref:hypothetical protein n=1 Tax=Microbacterium sp. LWH11-1.2 TaxID=3135258 RepID=UPI003139FDCF
MRKQISRALSLAAVGLVLILTGCTATDASALRINSDGSVDYVTCVSDANDWYAVSYESEDQQQGVELHPAEPLSASSEGAVVRFSPPDDEWYSITVGASVFASVRVRSESFTPDEWHWNNGGWFDTSDRCSIEE